MADLQRITLQAYYSRTGTAQLPVGVIVRDSATGAWQSYLLPDTHAEGWRPLVAFAKQSPAGLTEELLQIWMAQVNGITLDLEVETVQTDSLEAALDAASDEIMGRFAEMVEEV